MTSPRPYVIISANPKSGTRSRTELLQQLHLSIVDAGMECELHYDLSVMSARARELSNQGVLKTVVSAGGDGTASTVASLIPQTIPITIFPIGSENLLANYLGATADVERCVSSIVHGKIRRMDTLIVGQRLSLLMASAGYDAEVVRRVHQSRKSHITRWSYWQSIFWTLVRYHWPTLRVSILDPDSESVETLQASWVFVFNIPRYAAGLTIIADTEDNDGYFDVGVFGPGGWLNGIWCYWNVARGRHQRMGQWRRFRARSIRIDCLNGNSSCQADGDWISELPIDISIANRTAEFIVS